MLYTERSSGQVKKATLLPFLTLSITTILPNLSECYELREDGHDN
jgi:hypothetical protein